MGPDLERLLDRVADCLDRRTGGRFESTRARHRTMAEFFHFYTLYPVAPSPVREAREHLVDLFGQLFAAYDRLLVKEDRSDPEWRAVCDELDAVGRLVAEAMDVVWRHRRAGELAAAAAAATAALARVFDWSRPGHLRAYVYARTGELLSDGVLGNNRSHFIDTLAECLREAE